MKKDGTISKLAVKWFGFQPDAEDSANKIAPGTGVPGMDGYDPTPVTPKCA
jgi:polar amino acid transport system substrate-binding protein